MTIIEIIRVECEHLNDMLDELPPVQEVIEAKKKLDECMMWASKAYETSFFTKTLEKKQ